MRRDGACIPMQGAVSRQGRAACGAAKVCSRASSTHGHRGRLEKYTTRGALSICADACPARLTRAGAAATGARRASGPSPATTAPLHARADAFTRRADCRRNSKLQARAATTVCAIPAGVRRTATEEVNRLGPQGGRWRGPASEEPTRYRGRRRGGFGGGASAAQGRQKKGRAR
jgi:hypothetical protein